MHISMFVAGPKRQKKFGVMMNPLRWSNYPKMFRTFVLTTGRPSAQMQEPTQPLALSPSFILKHSLDPPIGMLSFLLSSILRQPVQAKLFSPSHC